MSSTKFTKLYLVQLFHVYWIVRGCHGHVHDQTGSLIVYTRLSDLVDKIPKDLVICLLEPFLASDNFIYLHDRTANTLVPRCIFLYSFLVHFPTFNIYLISRVTIFTTGLTFLFYGLWKILTWIILRRYICYTLQLCKIPFRDSSGLLVLVSIFNNDNISFCL